MNQGPERLQNTARASRGQAASRAPRTLATGLLAIIAAACQPGSSAPPPAPTIRLVEHLDVLDRTTADGALWPANGVDHFGRGFRCRGPGRGPPESREAPAVEPSSPRANRRVCGPVAEAAFRVAARSDHLLRLELRAPAELPSQRVTLLLNKTVLQSIELERGWASYEIDLPASALRLGPNELRMEFRDTTDAEPYLAARMRRLEVHAARTPAEVASLRPVGGEVVRSPDGAAIRMAGDAEIRIALLAGPQTRLTSTLRAVGSRPAVEARIEVLAEGEVPAHSDAQAGAGRPAHAKLVAAGPVELDLSPWAGRRIVVRLATGGASDRAIEWFEPTLEGAVEFPGIYRPPVAQRPERPPTPAAAPAPDILLILLDAARADAISAYGAARPTPAIDRLAADGIRFTNAFSTASWTAPSVASLLTGLPVSAHGVSEWTSPIGTGMTLAERLAERGYRTVLWSQHVLWQANRSLRAGFEEVVLVGPRARDRLPSRRLLHDPDRPTFALVHLLLPHGPYEPTERFRGRYTPERDEDISPGRLRLLGLRRLPPPTAELTSYTRDRYDEMMAWADERVGAMLNELRQAGHYEPTLVVLTADHGEAFFEHGAFLHTAVLHRSVLGVPLIIKPAGGRGARSPMDERLASLLDLRPTLERAAGLQPADSFGLPGQGRGRPAPPDAEATAGIDLLSSVPGSAYRALRATTGGVAPDSRRLSLVTPEHHLIYHPQTGWRALYEIRNDPAERHDLAATNPVLTAWLIQSVRPPARSGRLLATSTGRSSAQAGGGK